MSQSPDTRYNKDVENGLDHQEFAPLTKSVTLTSEQFERLYLGPKNQYASDMRKRLGNPTPVALLGFSVGLLPLSIAFMGWRGAGGSAVATTTCGIWFGGLLLIIAGIGEFLVGNTFPMVVFLGYGAHFLTFNTALIPWFNAAGFFAPTSAGTPGQGMENPEFLASFAYYPVALCVLSFVFLIGSLRTNAVFVGIFAFATVGFGCGAGGYFHMAAGNMVVGGRCLVGLGACFFAACVLGWYLLLAEMITIMELPIPDLPVLELSTIIKRRSRSKSD